MPGLTPHAAKEFWNGQFRLAGIARRAGFGPRDDDAERRAAAATVDELRRRAGKSEVVLEIGCGTGLLLELLAPSVPHLIGVDVSGVALDEARPRLSRFSNVSLLECDGATLGPVADCSVDFAFSLLCFTGVDRPTLRSYLLEARRVLRPHGTAWLQFFHQEGQDGRALVADLSARRWPAEAVTIRDLDAFARESALKVTGTEVRAAYLFAEFAPC